MGLAMDSWVVHCFPSSLKREIFLGGQLSRLDVASSGQTKPHSGHWLFIPCDCRSLGWRLGIKDPWRARPFYRKWRRPSEGVVVEVRERRSSHIKPQKVKSVLSESSGIAFWVKLGVGSQCATKKKLCD